MTEPGRNPNRSGISIHPDESADDYVTRAQNIIDSVKARQMWWDEKNYSVYRIKSAALSSRSLEWIWDAITYKIEPTWN